MKLYRKFPQTGQNICFNKPTQIIRLLFFWILTILPLYATTYYVDYSTGNDANPGSSMTAPWKTIARINSAGFLPTGIYLYRFQTEWGLSAPGRMIIVK